MEWNVVNCFTSSIFHLNNIFFYCEEDPELESNVMRNKNKFASHSINMNFEVELEKKNYFVRDQLQSNEMKWNLLLLLLLLLLSFFSSSSFASLLLCLRVLVDEADPAATWLEAGQIDLNDEKSNCCCWITHFSYGALGWVDGWSPHIAVRAKELETYFMLNIIFKKSLFYIIQFIIRLRQVTRLPFINQLNSLVFLTIFKSQTTTTSLFKKSSLWLLVWWSRLVTRVSLWMQELTCWFFIIISPSALTPNVKTSGSQRKIYT